MLITKIEVDRHIKGGQRKWYSIDQDRINELLEEKIYGGKTIGPMDDEVEDDGAATTPDLRHGDDTPPSW